MKYFVDSLYDTITIELTAKKAVMKKKLQLSLKLISQNQSVTRRLISQNWSVDSSSEKDEEDRHVDVNFDEAIDLAINYFSVFKIEFQRKQ